MIHSLRLQQFRSYKDESFEFEPGVNIIVGPNASGKTNLIESIMFTLKGGSYRGRDIELMRHGDAWTRVDVQVEDEGQRTLKLQEELGKIKKTIEIHERQFARMPATRKVPFILFEPNHLLMFHGGPEIRRDFIDSLLEQTKSEFSVNRRQYKRALLQRNNLLKRGNIKPDELFVWNVRLSELGGAIAHARQRVVTALNEQLPNIYKQIAGTETEISVQYKSVCRSESYASDLLKKLENNIEKELLRGYTLYGPHRDDIEVLLHGYSAKEAASRGEIRTIVLAFKVFEQTELEQILDKKPILLLDDVFSELDGARRHHLTDFLKDHQVFITTTDADVVVQHFSEQHKIIALTRPSI